MVSSNRSLINLDRTLPTKLACTECRRKHLKCDGGAPICSRCLESDRECVYVQSRRGYKPQKSYTKIIKPISIQLLATKIPTQTVFPSTPLNNMESVLLNEDRYSRESSGFNDLALPVLPKDNYHSIEMNYNLNKSPHFKFVNVFYSHFHPAHPFLLPRQLLSLLLDSSESPSLIQAIEYVGSLYAKPSDGSLKFSPPKIDCSSIARHGWSVQLLLLMSIASHFQGDGMMASKYLDTAIEIALEIGMNHCTYSTTKGQGVPVLEESWRRTWWELFCTEVMLAAVNQRKSVLKNVEMDVELPCEEYIYNNQENIPSGYTISDLDKRFFDLGNVRFSSFSFRIAVVRVLTSVLEVGTTNYLDYSENYDLADASLRNLALHLPDSKSELVNSDGESDEMLFETHMILHAATIHLHRPRSNLPLPLTTIVAQCVPENDESVPYRSVAYHTAQTIKSAESISSLIQLPVSITKHTPFFTCAIALSSFVQLSQQCLIESEAQSQRLKKEMLIERLRLNVGALKVLGKVWEMAAGVRDQTLAAIRHVNEWIQNNDGREENRLQTKEPQSIREIENGLFLEFFNEVRVDSDKE